MKKTSSLPNAIPPDGTNPHGRVKDETAKNAGDGTPVNDESSGDVRVSMEELISRVGDTINNEKEDSVNGFQIVDAIYKVPPPDDSVSTAKIQDGAVIPDKIANDAINNDKIATDAVNSDSIAANAVGSSEIANSAVGTSQLANDSVNQDKIANNAVGSDQIQANAVGSSEIASNAVGTDEIGFPSVTVIGSGTYTIGNVSNDGQLETVTVPGMVTSDFVMCTLFRPSTDPTVQDASCRVFCVHNNTGNFTFQIKDNSTGVTQSSDLSMRYIVFRLI